jgi:hypothetical protein
LERIDLRASNLVEADLGKALMWRADLRQARLTATRCEQVIMIRANLTHADCDRAVLHRADLRLAELQFANMSQANLAGANLSYANLTGANLAGANLSYANLTGANLAGANLSRAQLAHAIVIKANWVETILHDIDLSHVDINLMDLKQAIWRERSVSPQYPLQSSPTFFLNGFKGE